MNITGLLTKMLVENNSPILYYLNINNKSIAINQLLGKNINISFVQYQCVECGRNKEIYSMGCCKNCYFTSPHTGQWILRPELSLAHLGKADRDLDIESDLQLQPHIVYLANTGSIKVGVTRKSQIPTRWIDQGAEYAIQLAETKNRYQAGLIELALKQHITDKTNYRKMLKSDVPLENLLEKKMELLNYVPETLRQYVLDEDHIFNFKYPIIKYPQKITSINLRKKAQFDGVLIGVKGQYLLFKNNFVFNVRNHEGFVVNLRIE